MGTCGGWEGGRGGGRGDYVCRGRASLALGEIIIYSPILSSLPPSLLPSLPSNVLLLVLKRSSSTHPYLLPSLHPSLPPSLPSNVLLGELSQVLDNMYDVLSAYRQQQVGGGREGGREG